MWVNLWILTVGEDKEGFVGAIVGHEKGIKYVFLI
jgi:hypothetical protein